MYDFFDFKYIIGEYGSYFSIVAIITIISFWIIFNKAGEAGWKSIIPIYNFYILSRIVNLSFGMFVLAIIGLFIPFVNLISAIYIMYYYFAIDFRLARAFGRGTLFALGLVFLNTIFIIILAFSNFRYDRSNI